MSEELLDQNLVPAEDAVEEISAEDSASVVESAVEEGAPKNWYIIHTYSGFERKVKESLESRVARSEDEAVRLDHHAQPEFDGWRWVTYWYPLGQIVAFKREVYRRALTELEHHLHSRAHARRIRSE